MFAWWRAYTPWCLQMRAKTITMKDPQLKALIVTRDLNKQRDRWGHMA